MKQYRPTSPARRQMTSVDYAALSGSRPLKRLTFGRARRSGRARGIGITVRHKGGGAKQRYRRVDFRQNKIGIPGRVVSIEYDPNRTAFIVRVVYVDGEQRYLLAAQDMRVGDTVLTAPQTPLRPGNRAQLKHIPVGAFVHNVELFPGKGGQLIRSAGAAAQVMAHEGGWVHLKLPSTEVRKVPEQGYASLGFVSNPEHGAVAIGKAGRRRLMGVRPTVRGSAMNPVDHPHGGGEGRAPIGLPGPKTPWGKPARGVKTRKRHRPSGRLIVARRSR
ncbi:50S ribosomal protein L2 [Candidatus Parcubacteria bacterium]|nr:50S ribosomal protein L2 [Candidatus Parcubacteria bacterium]